MCTKVDRDVGAAAALYERAARFGDGEFYVDFFLESGEDGRWCAGTPRDSCSSALERSIVPKSGTGNDRVSENETQIAPVWRGQAGFGHFDAAYVLAQVRGF